MFCSQCGQSLNGNIICPNCGHNNINHEQLQNTNQYVLKQKYDNTFKSQVIIGICISCSIIIIAFVYLMLTSDSDSVYFSNENNVNNHEKEQVKAESEKNTSNMIGVTNIIYDNKYYLNEITTEEAILSMVKEDSKKQKDNCNQNIIEIEERIINNYQIEAVNLCEMNVNTALELENVIKYIYDRYPTARGYLTHISLGNISSVNTIAFFQWIAPFTYSTEDSLIGYKSRIILNSSYYLNEAKLKVSVQNGSNSGHFPENATMYSPLAHEFAHYLSFIATNNYYSASPEIIYNPNDSTSPYVLAISDFSEGIHSKKMVTEAYENYKVKTNTNMTFDEFRGSISEYAIAKDERGEYIYDETIAEAFHDVYLNGSDAADASKEIVSVLEKYLEM